MHWLIEGLVVSMAMLMVIPTDVHAQGDKVVAQHGVLAGGGNGRGGRAQEVAGIAPPATARIPSRSCGT